MPVTTPPSITALPTPPDPNDRATFNARAYPWSVGQQTFATQVGAVAANVFANATDAAASATTAGSARDDALQAQAAAEAASSAVQWVSGTTYAIGDVAWSPIDFKSYRRKTAGAGTTDPSADATNWQALGASGSALVRSARTSNTVLGSADKGMLIDITSGTFTQTFSACTTLADGWWCYIRNAGTGDITLDPNASETIDGLTSFVMYPGEVRLIQCDGTALRSVVLNAFYKAFTASGTFTKPPGYSVFEGMLWGGGAGAKWANWFDGSDTRYRQFSGGGGGCMPFTKRAADLLASETVTVGAGGVRTTTHNATSNAGGNSTFAGITAFGGDSNGNAGGTANGVTAGAGNYDKLLQYASSTDVTIALQFVGTILKTTTNPAIPSLSFYGGGCGCGLLDSLSQNTSNIAGGITHYGGGGGASLAGARGTSFFGGRGADASNAAEAPGGGGHGSSVATYGDGARGEVRIWGVI